MQPAKYAPDSLKYQWRLLALVMRSDWATGLDKSVAYEIIDNYRKDFGNSRTSLSYLQQATGAKRSNITASLRRICAGGHISVARIGIGTRPTEYNLNFDLVAEKASSPAEATTSSDIASGPAQGTTGSPAQGTTNASSGPAQGTQTVLRNRLTAELQEDGYINTPSPYAGGLAATAGDGDPFERFWSTYPRKYQKPKARAAWVKINPGGELAERIIEAAGEWAAHYIAHPIDKKWMPAPANWLSGERYDEDLPAVYEDPKEAAIARKAASRKAAPANESTEAEPSAKPDFSFPPNRQLPAKITRAEVSQSEDDGATLLEVWFTTSEGHEVYEFITTESPDAGEQERGQRSLAKLLNAAEVEDIDADGQNLVARAVEISFWPPDKFIDVYKPWIPSAEKKPRPRQPSFEEIVARTPLGGWAGMIGSDYEDEEEAA